MAIQLDYIDISYGLSLLIQTGPTFLTSDFECIVRERERERERESDVFKKLKCTFHNRFYTVDAKDTGPWAMTRERMLGQ